jgi:hypothetical protein
MQIIFNKKKLYNFSLILLLCISTGFFLYGVYGFGVLVHFDEYVGRGLYPALALAYGNDLYEPLSGPHITLYGFATALFYAPAAIGNSPQICIWISFVLNFLALLLPTIYFLNHVLHSKCVSIEQRLAFILSSIIIIFSLLLIEQTTEGVLRIHADLPAFSFILFSACFFVKYLQNEKIIFLVISTIFIALSVCAKVTTLPAIFFPHVYFFIKGNYKAIINCAVSTIGVGILICTIAFVSFGFDDCVTILFKHVKENRWFDRNHLFDGPGKLIQMGYIEATPLLFRFFTMYISQYWFILLPVILIFHINLAKNCERKSKSIITIFCILYFLTLPACLVALAHYGSVHNSLLFANATGILVIVFSTIFSSTINNTRMSLLALSVVATLCTLPTIRISKSTPKSTDNSPHQQAFNYLKNGKNDIFFGWYPISHLLHRGKAYTSIEVPIHLSETMPENVEFSRAHFPEGTEFLATGPSGIGPWMLQPYIGVLTEIDKHKELSNWRLYMLSKN